MASKQIEPIWMQVAREELGVAEIAGKKHSKRVLEYHQATSLKASDDETAWCSAFVCWCLEKAGHKSTRSAAARSYLQWGKALPKGVPGCVVVFKRGTKAWQGHVAFYVDETKDTIRVLGGNQSNKVCIASYPKSSLLGYRWPA